MIRHWIEAMRLRTVPVSVAGVIAETRLPDSIYFTDNVQHWISLVIYNYKLLYFRQFLLIL